MSGIYKPRHPEHTVFYSVLFHYFEPFLQEYEDRLEREYGHLRPIVQEVVEKHLDCGNSECGFARIRCPDCGTEKLVMFSCKTRGFCPSCHAKSREQWGEWMREKPILDTSHRQVVFTIPKMLWIFFIFSRSLLSELCVCGKEALMKYFRALARRYITPAIIAVIQSFGGRINFYPHLHFMVTEGGTDKQGKFHKVSQFNDSLLCRFFTLEVFSLLLGKQLINQNLVQKILHWRHTGFNVPSKVRTETKEDAERVGKYMIRPILSLKRLSLDEEKRQVVYQYGKHRAEMIKKVYEIDPLICPKCGGTMRIVSFIEDYKVIDKIIKHLKLTFKAERPPPSQAQFSMAAEEQSKYM